ncbi:unnamed protein product [Pieris macdunnoughi]|uniref:Malate dehydrogenase n=1 Tax=Pieris macdunnoughi TaxID=345717 RepID=A0A821QPY8_9NEOP|nr:unnamed protein product [Pieris macdunnoughi]
MNLQCRPVYESLRVLIFNGLSPTGKLIIAKIMSGIVFGKAQLVDLHIIVYSNEINIAEGLKNEVVACAFPCINSIKVSSDLPSVADGDVFCFITNFPNPNSFDFNNEPSEEVFDTLYLITKLANNFIWPEDTEDEGKQGKNKEKQNKTKRKPIFVTDGLIAIDILNSLSKNMPPDVFYCSTPITAIGKSILAEYLNVHCNVINKVLVWAANDETFHIEVKKPFVIHEESDSQCDSGLLAKDFLESLNLDPTQFNATWMKKDFIEKIAMSASKNPYGCIYKAAEFARTLRNIWKARDSSEIHCNMGVISDGSLGTAKGLPYVLPIIMKDDMWNVSTSFYEESAHLKQELKRINVVVKNHHKKLIIHCKRFLEENVINQAFIPSDVDSGSVY